MQTKSSRKDLY